MKVLINSFECIQALCQNALRPMKYSEPAVVSSFLPDSEKEKVDRVRDGVSASTPPLVERIRQGLPMAEFKALVNLLQIPEDELGRYLGISAATLHRRKKLGHLEAIESERVVRFARLFGLAMQVFETEDAVRSWLKAANPGTAGESPLSYADTEFGAREVEDLLGRIDHGIF